VPWAVRGTPYQLECSDWIAGISAHGAPGPRAWVQLRAEYLMRVGAPEGLRAVSEWFERVLLPLVDLVQGTTPTWRISRLDLAVDVAGAALTRDDEPWFTTRASAREAREEPLVTDQWRRQLTSLRFGRRGSPVYARLYLKSFEASADAPVRRCWAEAGYDPAEHGSDIWRIEFEFRSSFLREAQVDGEWLPRDPHAVLAHHLPSLWRYATQRWLVLRDRQRPATRIERTPRAGWWQALGESPLFGDPGTGRLMLRRATPPPRDGAALLRMGVGCLASFASVHGHATWSETRDALDDYVRRVLGEEAWCAMVAERSGGDGAMTSFEPPRSRRGWRRALGALLRRIRPPRTKSGGLQSAYTSHFVRFPTKTAP
jgi:hypothetical protein